MDKLLDWITGKTAWFLLIPISIVVLFSLAVPIYLSTQPNEWKLGYDVNGAIGDFFGGIMNPVIALMALVWLVKGVRLQQKELEETKVALQASEQHQASQVRIAAITALITSLNDEHNKLRAYRQTLEPELDELLKVHDRHQSEMEPWNTLSPDDETEALLKEFSALESAVDRLETQRDEYLSDLRKILEKSTATTS